MNKSKIIPIIFFIVSLIFTIILLAKQFQTGLTVTGLNEPNVWGLYISSFAFSIGVGAGVLLLVFYLNLRNKLSNENFLKLSFIALASFCLAGVFITLDLGQPFRFYYFITSPNFDSPLVWDFWVMNILIIMSLALIVLGFKKKSLPKPVSIVFAIVTIAGYFVTTEAFSSLKARINWNTPILNLIFIIAAITGGMALYLLFSNKEDEFTSKMPFKAVLSVLLVIDLALFAVSYLNASNLMIVYLVLGNILPIIMIFTLINKSQLVKIITALLILASMWFKRSDIIFAGYTKSWMPNYGKVEYISTTIEKLLVFNVFLLGIIALVIVFGMITKKEEEKIA